MKFKRTALAIVAGTAMATAGFASASMLQVDGGTIQYGASGVTCDANGVKVNWGLETDDNTIRFIVVSDIAADCQGSTLFVKVGDQRFKVDPIDATSETVRYAAPFPSAESIQNVKIWIEG